MNLKTIKLNDDYTLVNLKDSDEKLSRLYVFIMYKAMQAPEIKISKDDIDSILSLEKISFNYFCVLLSHLEYLNFIKIVVKTKTYIKLYVI